MLIQKLPLFIFTILFATLVSCGDQKNDSQELSADQDELVVLHTKYGSLTLLLYDETPLHKHNFLKLAKEQQYDSTIFHRVIKHFMIQGGDINAKTPDNSPIDYTIPAEIVPGFLHHKGALAAARMGDHVNPKKESSGSQFYIIQGKVFSMADIEGFQLERTYGYVQNGVAQLITREEYTSLKEEIRALQNQGDFEGIQKLVMDQKENVESIFGPAPIYSFTDQQIETYTSIGGSPHLDGEYTVFGRVVDGLGLVDLLGNQPTQSGDKPVEEVKIWMEIQRVAKSEIIKKYGYNYPDNE